jgi:hypothetical protein
MQKYRYLIHLIFVLLIGLIVCLKLAALGKMWWEHREKIKAQSGTYKFNLERTSLYSYAKDSLLYKNLTLTLKTNQTYQFNMAVPFLTDIEGDWKAYNDIGNYICFSDADDCTLISTSENGATIHFLPWHKMNERSVGEVYFTKISDNGKSELFLGIW